MKRRGSVLAELLLFSSIAGIVAASAMFAVSAWRRASDISLVRVTGVSEIASSDISGDRLPYHTNADDR